MEKELVMACILISISTILKIWSVIALYHVSIAVERMEHTQVHQSIVIEKGSRLVQ